MANMDLCSRLTGNVGSMSAEIFYERFNQTGADQIYAEFNFDEMKQIYGLQGMEQWPEMLGGNHHESPIRLSMVCFKPPPPSTSSGKNNQNRVMTAASKAREMLYSSFPSNEDRASIDVAMSVFPSIAIFMSQPHGSTRKRHQKEGHEQTKLRKSRFESIFDVNGSSLLQCLAVVVYFREETHTQVIWLSTTLESPPRDSSNVMWRKMGLATYLLCMLVKQHNCPTIAIFMCLVGNHVPVSRH